MADKNVLTRANDSRVSKLSLRVVTCFSGWFNGWFRGWFRGWFSGWFSGWTLKKDEDSNPNDIGLEIHLLQIKVL